MAKVVLAYSGGLDTSVCIRWLKEAKGLDVVAFSADVGQGRELDSMGLEQIGEKALKTGAVSAHVVDLKERFVDEFVFPALKAGAVYGDGYLLATSLSRPLIAAELVRIAGEEGAESIAHGCTGKGNDQVRFEASVAALAPHLEVIAPLREWDLLTREAEIEYAEKHGIPVPVTRSSPYSYDRNLWGISIECGALEDPWTAPPEEAYIETVAPEEAPDEPAEVEITFEEGLPVAVDGEKMSGLDIVTRLRGLGAAHGVGRIDVIEDRLVGIKSREIYEAPAATILHTAHRALEYMCLPKDVLEEGRVLSLRYGRLVYNGRWFSLLKDALDAFFDRTQGAVSGTVRVKLHKGRAAVTGRASDRALYDRGLSTYDVGDTFDREASEGFVKLWSLPLRVEGARKRRGKA